MKNAVAKGKNYVPAASAITSDEIGVILGQEKTPQIALTFGRMQPRGNTAQGRGNDIGLSITTNISVSMTGAVHMQHIVKSATGAFDLGTKPLDQGLRPSSSVHFTPSGSQLSAHNKYDIAGTMKPWLKSMAKAMRDGQGLHEEDTLILFMDQCGVHTSDVELFDYARDELNIVIIFLPANTTPWLAFNDTRFINREVRKAYNNTMSTLLKLGGIVDANEVLKIIENAVSVALSSANVYKAAKQVGFKYEDAHHSIIRINDEDAEEAVNKFAHLYSDSAYAEERIQRVALTLELEAAVRSSTKASLARRRPRVCSTPDSTRSPKSSRRTPAR